MSNLNWLDLIVLILLLLSIGAGILRGFAREVIAVIAWIAGIFIASKLAPSLASYFTSSSSVQSTLSSASTNMGVNAAQPVSYLAIGLSFVVIFILVLIAGKLLSYFFTGAIQLSGLGFLNGLLGGVFGLIRGVLVVVVLMFLLQLTSFAQESYWHESRFVNLFQPAIQWMNMQAIPGWEALKTKAGVAWQNINNRYPAVINELRSVEPSPNATRD